MKYLLDVNALVALGHPHHPFYERFHAWHARQAGVVDMASCAICDLGFIRVCMKVYNYTLPKAEQALALVKRDASGYIDTLPPPRLAPWVLVHKQTTDAYLCQLAAANGMKLATFDSGIKDGAAYLIS